MANQNEALGLPPGSVRAILALCIIPLTEIAAVVLMMLMFWRNEYTIALGILSGLTGTSGLVVGYYFGNKSANKATDEIVKAHKDVSDVHKNIIANDLAIIQNDRDIIAHKDREINQISRGIYREIPVDEIV